MKKIALAIIAVVLAVTSIFCFTACGDTPEQKLQNYIESDSFQSQLTSMKSSFESTMDIDVKTEGEKLIMQFDYKQDIPDSAVDTIKSVLENNFDSNSGVFVNIADTIKKEVGIENPEVVIEINTNDGTNLITQTYGASE